MTPGKMSCKLTAEQIGVTASNQQVFTGTLETINQKLPLGEILNFIKENMEGVTVNFVNGRKK